MKVRLPRISNQAWNWVLLIVAGLGLLLYRLVLLTPGLATNEQPLSPVRDTLRVIWDRPLELPLELSRLAVAAATPTTGIGYTRLPNVVLGIALLLVAFWLLKRWYGYRLALFGSALLASAPWFLHVSRLASSDIVYPLGCFSLMALAALWHQKERSRKLVYVTVIAGALLLYVPGFIWLLFGLALSERRNILSSLKQYRWHSLLASSLGLALLVPLAHAILIAPDTAKLFLGLPSELPSLHSFGAALIRVWPHIFVGGYINPIYNLGGLPLVDITVSLGFLVGIYLYAQHPKAVRSRQLLFLWLAGTLLIAANGPVSYSLILPIVLVLAVGGLGYLLHLWLKVFPRNPVARGFGIGLMALVLLFTVAYNVRNYYIAWPNNGDTRAAFQRQL